MENQKLEQAKKFESIFKEYRELQELAIKIDDEKNKGMAGFNNLNKVLWFLGKYLGEDAADKFYQHIFDTMHNSFKQKLAEIETCIEKEIIEFSQLNT